MLLNTVRRRCFKFHLSIAYVLNLAFVLLKRKIWLLSRTVSRVYFFWAFEGESMRALSTVALYRWSHTPFIQVTQHAFIQIKNILLPTIYTFSHPALAPGASIPIPWWRSCVIKNIGRNNIFGFWGSKEDCQIWCNVMLWVTCLPWELHKCYISQ